jgi:hypothetical protein
MIHSFTPKPHYTWPTEVVTHLRVVYDTILAGMTFGAALCLSPEDYESVLSALVTQGLPTWLDRVATTQPELAERVRAIALAALPYHETAPTAPVLA